MLHRSSRINCYFQFEMRSDLSPLFIIYVLHTENLDDKLQFDPFYIIPVAPVYWIKEYPSWQVIFGFVVIDLQVPSHLTFIYEESMTYNLSSTYTF